MNVCDNGKCSLSKATNGPSTTHIPQLYYVLLPKFPCLLIHVTPNGPPICHLLLPSLSSLSLSLALFSVIGLQLKEGTSIPICSYSFFFFTLISRYSVDTLALLYMHFFVLRISRASEKRCLSHLHHGRLIAAVCYHHLSLLQCHSRAKELCVVFAQLLHLHVIMTSIVPTKCLITKSLWLVSKAPAFSLCLAT